MTYLRLPGRGRKANNRTGQGSRPISILFGLTLGALLPQQAVPQEETSLEVADLRHRSATDLYNSAVRDLEAYEAQFTQVSQTLDEAIAAGDDEAALDAYARVRQVAGLRRRAQRQVEERAEELREARRMLLEANRTYLQDLLDQARTVEDPVQREALASLIEGTSLEIGRLRTLPEPEITLEVLPEINIEARDGPIELRLKAGRLEFAATKAEEQQTYFSRQLEDLRRDQRLFQISRDFLADRERFGDRPPVGGAGARNVPPPEQLEQQIEELELLQEELAQRIQIIRNRAADFRRRAGGGEWA